MTPAHAMLTPEARVDLRALVSAVKGRYGATSEFHHLAALAEGALAAAEQVERELEDLRGRRLYSAVFAYTEKNCPQPFAVMRHEDVTGQSGTGVIAYGCMFPHTGWVYWVWASPNHEPTATFAPSMAHLAPHLHEGKTQIVWLSESMEDLGEREHRANHTMSILASAWEWSHSQPTEVRESLGRALADAGYWSHATNDDSQGEQAQNDGLSDVAGYHG